MAQLHQGVRRLSRHAGSGFEPLEDRRLLSSFTLDSQGNLYESTASGSVEIDSGVISFAIAADGTLYDHHDNGAVNEFEGGTLLSFDTGVMSFVLDSDGSVYDLHTDGTLDCYNPSASPSAQWSQVAGDVRFLASADMGGSVWYLAGNGSEWVTGDAAGTREVGGGGFTDLVTGDSGRYIYALDSDGVLYYGSDALGGEGVVATGVTQMATADLGMSLWYIKGIGGAVLATIDGGAASQVGGGAIEVASAPSDLNAYVLESDGDLYQASDALGGMSIVEPDVSSFTFGSNGQLFVMRTNPTWSGYVAEATPLKTDSVEAVSGTWTVPSVAPSTTGAVAEWVGIDGYNGDTVEQIGTEEYYDNYTHNTFAYAWWEMYSTGAKQPQQDLFNASTNTGLLVRSGDSMTASVQDITSGNDAGDFVLSIVDSTTGQSFSTPPMASSPTQSPTALDDEAEWIVEAPSTTISGVTSVDPLANFGSVTFTGASATIDGVTGPIDDPAWQLVPLNIVDTNGGEDATAPLVDSGSTSGFSVSFGAPSLTPTFTPTPTSSATSNPSPTSTTLSVSPGSLTYGQPADFSATVAIDTSGGAPPTGGTVTFMDGSIALGTVGVTDGAASLTTTLLGAGSNEVTAIYSGDGEVFAGSSSTNSLQVPVARAPLTITAVNITRVYGAALPPLPYTISGLVNGDSASVVFGMPSLSTNAEASSAVGVYPIDAGAGTLSATNYSFPEACFVDGTLTVTPAAATLRFGSLLLTYNGSAQAATVVTSPAGLGGATIAYSQNGVAIAAPTQPGSYSVTAALINPNYTAISITGILIVNPQTSTQTVIIGQHPFFQRRLNKKGKPTGKAVLSGFALDFGVALNATAAENAANYQVDAVTTKKIKKKKETIPQPITNFTVSYLAASDAVEITLGSAQTFPSGGQMTVSGGLTTASGGTLSGAAVFTISKGGKSIEPA
jgi:MBG domain (YGX type)/Bacterial Ig-like domain (group 3)/MBG domain